MMFIGELSRNTSRSQVSRVGVWVFRGLWLRDFLIRMATSCIWRWGGRFCKQSSQEGRFFVRGECEFR